MENGSSARNGEGRENGDSIEESVVSEWSNEEVQESELFANTVHEKNLRGLLFAGAITCVGFMLFWITDHHVMPELTTKTFFLRLAVSLYGLMVFVGAFFEKKWIANYTTEVSLGVFVLTGIVLTALLWMAGGLTTRYYAGFNIWFIVLVIFFIFPRNITYSMLWGGYGLYMSPWFVLGTPLEQPMDLITNQFFLVGILIICTIGYHFRYQLMIQGVRNRLRQRECTEKYRKLSRFDNLTGLLNRETWLEELEDPTGRSPDCRSASHYSSGDWIVMLDVDHFKEVNDQYGHQAGDKVLSQLGDFLDDKIRLEDPVARFGGEEFIVLLNEAENPEAIANRLREDVSEKEFTAKGEKIPVSVSVGLAQWDSGNDLENVIGQADEALYVAKAQGRNRVEAYEKLEKTPTT